MRITTWRILVASIFLLVSSFLLMNGCGKTLNGHTSGGCPDSVAPAGATIVAPANLGAPFINSATCYPTLGFTVKDSNGNPMNDICVEVFSDALVALHTGNPDCGNVTANPQTGLVARTDNDGNVMIELLTGPTPTGNTHFVSVSSGAIGALATTAPAAK